MANACDGFSIKKQENREDKSSTEVVIGSARAHRKR